LLAIAAGCCWVSAAGAAQPILTPRLSLTAAGMRVAQGPVLESGHCGLERGWIGGQSAPRLAEAACENFYVRVDALVLKGTAASQFTSEDGAYASHVQAFASNAMVERYFARVFAPAFIPCFRAMVGAVLLRNPGSRPSDYYRLQGLRRSHGHIG
jgi:hypothetical protein